MADRDAKFASQVNRVQSEKDAEISSLQEKLKELELKEQARIKAEEESKKATQSNMKMPDNQNKTQPSGPNHMMSDLEKAMAMKVAAEQAR